MLASVKGALTICLSRTHMCWGKTWYMFYGHPFQVIPQRKSLQCLYNVYKSSLFLDWPSPNMAGMMPEFSPGAPCWPLLPMTEAQPGRCPRSFNKHVQNCPNLPVSYYVIFTYNVELFWWLCQDYAYGCIWQYVYIYIYIHMIHVYNHKYVLLWSWIHPCGSAGRPPFLDTVCLCIFGNKSQTSAVAGHHPTSVGTLPGFPCAPATCWNSRDLGKWRNASPGPQKTKDLPMDQNGSKRMKWQQLPQRPCSIWTHPSLKDLTWSEAPALKPPQWGRHWQSLPPGSWAPRVFLAAHHPTSCVVFFLPETWGKCQCFKCCKSDGCPIPWHAAWGALCKYSLEIHQLGATLLGCTQYSL